VRYLIVNADGYGFTEGISRAIEECIAFGTVRSISANVNFYHAEGLPRLVRRFPQLSVGCHINPVVGRPLSDPARVKSLLTEKGDFFYRDFGRRVLTGHIRMDELREEMDAQVERTRELAGDALSHVDFHMGLHRLPGVYQVFLDVAERSGVGRIRTHRYLMGMESRLPRLRHLLHMLGSPARIPKYCWNLRLRRKAVLRGLSMPDRWVGITNMADDSGRITVDNYLAMLRNLPQGFSEFVAHPGYIDEELKRWSTYLDQRFNELQVLLSEEFRNALTSSDVRLAGYRDIPLPEKGKGVRPSA
jgi:predicted glycoside hydrolase/deacetylase ChbG (UPF0249 family)